MNIVASVLVSQGCLGKSPGEEERPPSLLLKKRKNTCGEARPTAPCFESFAMPLARIVDTELSDYQKLPLPATTFQDFSAYKVLTPRGGHGVCPPDSQTSEEEAAEHATSMATTYCTTQTWNGLAPESCQEVATRITQKSRTDCFQSFGTPLLESTLPRREGWTFSKELFVRKPNW